MECPCCKGKLREVKFKKAITDICPACKGIWFDKGEFIDFMRTLTESEDISPQTPQLFKEIPAATIYTVKEEEKRCPKCSKKLHRFNYAYDSNVFLDKCLECEGMWADGGEVKEIAKYLKVDPRIKEIAKGLIERDKTLDDLVEFNEFLMSPRGPILFLLMPKIIIPLSDDNPRQRTPFITIVLITLCTLVFIGQVSLVSDIKNFVLNFGHIPAHFFSIGLITSLFLHGSFSHLLGNMYFLWLFGDNVEDRFSRFGYLIFYLACGIVATVMHSVFYLDSTVPSIGASGAISGIMGAYFMFYPKKRVKTFVFYRILYIPAFAFLGAWFFIQLIFGLVTKAAGISTGIGWFAHIGGFIFGGLVAYIMKRAKLEISKK